MAALEATLAQMSSGGGKKKLKDLSKQDLMERAAEEDVPGRSKMTKDELVDALS